MVLLDVLAKKPGLKLIVAHFNHGIRLEASKDGEFVAARAKQLELPLELGYGHLGESASEDTARVARYKFLEDVKRKYKADAIITAHHQDDLIETAFLNLLRGTGRKGLFAIKANTSVIRPLLNIPKEELLKYAKKNHVRWLVDSTNSEEKYLRNYVRHNIMPMLNQSQRLKLISNIDKVAKNETILNHQIATLSRNVRTGGKINRSSFLALPTGISNELLVYWLRESQVADFDKNTINRLNLALKTARAGTTQPVKGNFRLKIGQKTAQFSNTLQKK